MSESGAKVGAPSIPSVGADALRPELRHISHPARPVIFHKGRSASAPLFNFNGLRNGAAHTREICRPATKSCVCKRSNLRLSTAVSVLASHCLRITFRRRQGIAGGELGHRAHWS
jgi:hypothetical protein